MNKKSETGKKQSVLQKNYGRKNKRSTEAETLNTTKTKNAKKTDTRKTPNNMTMLQNREIQDTEKML